MQAVETEPFIELIAAMAPLYPWAYNGKMEIVNFPENSHSQIGARGTCPHCGDKSYCQPVSTFLDTSASPLQTMASAAKCQGCKSFVLVIGRRDIRYGGGNGPLKLIEVYPLGKPNDSVEDSVPISIAADFSEALRCHWIRAYKASVVMCARSVQASAIALGAKKKRLTDQIDELFAVGKITESLKHFAHEIRVTRNLGAHPDKDSLEEVDENDSSDIIEFTWEYLAFSGLSGLSACPEGKARPL